MVSAPEELGDLMKRGDERCAIPINSRVYKSHFETGDLHDIGDQGTVIGNIHIPDDGSPESSGMPSRDAYLVLFDGDPACSFCMGHKIDALHHGTH
jgi:hypothetical protein